MLCNAQPRNHLPVLLPHDYQYIIIVIAANISGGYMLSRSSYNIANFVSKEELKHAYHVNMLFTGLQMGIFSFISIVSVKLL
jgi:equilibrative nucleoside transporter 1/2/3